MRIVPIDCNYEQKHTINFYQVSNDFKKHSLSLGTLESNVFSIF